MSSPRRLPSPTDAERLVGMEMELELERHAEETREMERREREERIIEVNEMDRARREAESRMMGWNLGVGMAYRHGETIGNNIEPMNIDHLLRERTLQAERGRLGQGERAVWQENGETRYQEMARQQNPLSRRREENRRLGTAGFSSMEIGSQEAEEETRGGGGGKKLLLERQETEEERTERLRLNEKVKIKQQRRGKQDKEIINGNDPVKKRKLEQKRLKSNAQKKRKYQDKRKLEIEIMNGNDPIKKMEVEQARLIRNRNQRERGQRNKLGNSKSKPGKKRQEAEIMEEDDLLLRTTVRSKMFRKEKTNNRFQQKPKEWRKAQTQVEEDEDNDEDESEEEWEGHWQEEEGDE